MEKKGWEVGSKHDKDMNDWNVEGFCRYLERHVYIMYLCIYIYAPKYVYIIIYLCM